MFETLHEHPPDTEHLFDVPYAETQVQQCNIGEAGLTALAKAVESGVLDKLEVR